MERMWRRKRRSWDLNRPSGSSEAKAPFECYVPFSGVAYSYQVILHLLPLLLSQLSHISLPNETIHSVIFNR